MSTVDWDTAISVADRFSGSYPLADTYHERKFAMMADGYVARASAMVTEETGLTLPGSPVVDVITRHDWVRTNADAFAALMSPLEESLSQTSGVGRGVAGKVMGMELGAVLGFLSKRVLGQYELVLPTADGDRGDSVLFVGANVLAMERKFEFRPSHFRFWVALHESAHRAQFTGVPWMRDYFMSLVGELVASSKTSGGQVARVVGEVARGEISSDDLLGDAGLIGMFASPEQKAVLDKVQALMSLLEGHGHVVMDRIGEREIVDVARMSSVLKTRRKDPRTAAFMKLIGIEMKLKQYEQGARFIEDVETAASWDALSMAWESPDTLPTIDEIDDASKWLDRMHG
jgi:coenzyme F420 biosynthesis associated uncharacterized protein